jgi:diadenosine tetraphosphate (Ap4A) HIT family hydrolase
VNCANPRAAKSCIKAQFRVVLVDDANYPGFCRVIWRDHVKEITDLNELDRMLHDGCDVAG